MSGGSMAWWYWFGMWVFGIAGLVIAWWMLLDAWRRDGTAARFAWPSAATMGVVLQLPAFAVAESNRGASSGSMAAAIGVAGFVIVGVAAVAYFTRGAGGSGSTWSLRTRDSGSASSAARDRRVPPRPVRASVPISGHDASPGSPPVFGLAAEHQSSAESHAQQHPVGNAAVGVEPAPVRLRQEAMPGDEPTEIAEDTGAAEPTATLTDDAVPTLTDEMNPTIAEDADATITEEVGVTIIEEGDEPLESKTEAELVVTDGRTSRIVVTERSGPFLVGRDPSRCNLAIDDGRASRTHFSIQLVDGDYVIEDLGSSNGTFLNGAMLRESTVLNGGDTIEFGRTVATFRLPNKEIV